MSGSFEAHARETTVRHATRLGLVISAAALAWWPVDALFFDDPAVLRGFAVWRVGTVVTMATALALLHLSRRARRSAQLVTMVTMTVAGGWVGLGGSMSGELAPRYLDASTLLPLSSIILLVRWPTRLAATLAVTGAYLTPLLSTSAWDSTTAAQMNLTFFAGTVSFVFGQTYYNLVRRSHQQQIALDQRSRDLEELDRLKNDFFANVSHELRTPLTLILAMLGELRASDEDGTRLRVETAERNAARLLVMIDELLDLARFTGGGAELKRRHLDVAQLLCDVVAGFRSSEADSIALRGCEEPVVVHADPRQLRTALHNLLSNAHKFTDPAARRIEVALRRVGRRAEVSVADNGIGIPSAARERVFDRFYQVEGGRERTRGGAGIGLALVRDIASAHGGEVRVESSVGRGSTFTLAIPVGAHAVNDVASFDDDALSTLHRLASAAPVTAPRADVSDAGETLLIAEDDRELNAYLERLLGAHYRVLSASNGEEALMCVEETTPALVVTDAMMPGISGFELARRLRKRAATQRVPVLFLTARAGGGAREEAYEAGADDFLSKPFEPAELLARVKNLLDLRATERELAETNERLEQKVAERTAQLRELARHLERSREDERRRIARDLHDETGQLLTALRMELGLARDVASAPELAAMLERMDGILDQAFDATRALVSELRPRVLDDLGLGAAGEWYLGGFRERSGLACDFAIDPELSASPEASTAAFRILQEALTNVMRHSGAESVRVRLRREGDLVALEVADDGRGFDPSKTAAGYGLLGMRERVTALGGSFALESAGGRGTTLRVRVPAAPSAEA